MNKFFNINYIDNSLYLGNFFFNMNKFNLVSLKKNGKNFFFFFYNIVWFLNCFFLKKNNLLFSNWLNVGFFLKKNGYNLKFNSVLLLGYSFKNIINSFKNLNSQLKFLVNKDLFGKFLSFDSSAVKKWAKTDVEYSLKRDFIFENKT